MNNQSQRVLILDADSSAGLAAVQSLGRAGREVYIGIRNSGSTTESSRWSRQVYKQPASLPIETGVNWLLDLDRQFNFALIIPSTEASLLWLRHLPETHDVRKKAVISSNHSIDIALDKSRTSEIALQLGIPVPVSHLLSKGCPSNEPKTYPVVLKPVRSKVRIGDKLHSMTVAIVHNPEEREQFLRTTLPHTDIQEQSWVQGRGVGVEVLYNRGKLVWHFVHQRLHEWPLTGGASTLRKAAPDNLELVVHSRKLLDALNWHGVAMVEWRCAADGQFNLIEINPRLWGSLPLTIAAGINIPEGLFALSQGKEPATFKPWKVGVTARNLTKDVSWCIENARADRADPMLLTEPLARSAWGWFRVIAMREVWDGWSYRDPKVALHELKLMLRRFAKTLVSRYQKMLFARRARVQYKRVINTVASRGRPVANVLFLCYGNICRSPFAARVAHSHWNPELVVDSAGFHQAVGRQSPHHVVEAARNLGVDLHEARSATVTAEKISSADLILVMDKANFDRLVEKFPHAVPRTIMLGMCDTAVQSAEIADPYDLSPAKTDQVLKKIVRAVDCLGRQLKLDER